MQQNIYLGQKTLILASSMPEGLVSTPGTESLFLGPEISSEAIAKAIAQLEQGPTEQLVLVYPDSEALLEAVKACFVTIPAAGGLVWSDQQKVLLIFRKGKWDLPKGKLDPGENLETCAVREVEEETGLQQVRLEKPLCRTYHTYYQYGSHYLKESHWYLMRAPQQENLQPQLEEEIEQCIWVKPEELDSYLDNAHRSIVDVLQMALPQLR